MPLLKAEQVGRSEYRMERFSMHDIQQEADAILTEARVAAEAAAQQARVQADQIRQDAQRDGYQQGLTAGQQEGRRLGHEAALKQAGEKFSRSTGKLQEALGQLFANLTNDRLRLIAQLKGDLLRLATILAERVIKRNLEFDSETALRNLEGAMHLVEGATQVDVHLHPEQVSACEQFAASVLDAAKDTPLLKFVPDEQVSPGGCVLRCAHGSVDATVETQLARLVELILPGSAGQDAGHSKEDD